MQKEEHYKPFAEWKWRSYDGKKRVEIDDFVINHKEDMFFIGTDSQTYPSKKTTIFTTALIAYKMHKGGSIIIHKDRMPMMHYSRSDNADINAAKNIRERFLTGKYGSCYKLENKSDLGTYKIV